ncbi:MAG: TonB-dependent receptor plug domain-containing protein [Parabacteroides sp.]
MKKENLTGAVAQLKGDVLESRPVTNISQALQGTVANLNISSSDGGAPGGKQSINIRGYTGFGLDDSGNMVSKSQSPLVIIDGIQGGDLNTVNMEDVESISVLKDAASTAIYGSSAPYGVIIINTKKGKRSSKATITYNNNFGFAQPINLPHMLNSLDFANLYNEAADNAGIARPFTNENIQRIKDYQAGIMKDETIANPAAVRMIG